MLVGRLKRDNLVHNPRKSVTIEERSYPAQCLNFPVVLFITFIFGTFRLRLKMLNFFESHVERKVPQMKRIHKHPEA